MDSGPFYQFLFLVSNTFNALAWALVGPPAVVESRSPAHCVIIRVTSIQARGHVY